jgi:hypothetical protein
MDVSIYIGLRLMIVELQSSRNTFLPDWSSLKMVDHPGWFKDRWGLIQDDPGLCPLLGDLKEVLTCVSSQASFTIILLYFNRYINIQ